MGSTLAEINFNETIEKCISGDRIAQKQLYKDHYGFGMSICLRYCKTKDEALEVLNDGFLKVFKNLSKYDPKMSFRNWLKRILINTSIDFFRSQQKHYYHQDIDTAHSVSDTHENAINIINYNDILNLVSQLPNTYKINFSLFAIEGYSHNEIAALLKISVGTSKSNVSRAREILRKKLENISDINIK